jgi:NADH-dependant formate dehydrogenase delta subunit FdsD
MQSHNDNLQKMANDIAAFFTPQSQNEIPAAAKAIAGHIKLFWSPKMRSRFVEAFDAGYLPDLEPAVITALHGYRSHFVASGSHLSVAEKRELFPEGGGDAG